ncbi:hypothetical protein ACFXJO_03800 [Streptomyces lavendulae]|uniref:hypothetical protein n=1 Tax=Streptomyces lavendulae TaxID=1914 RepID=UPI0036A09B4B
MALTLDLDACSQPDKALAAATRLLEHPPQPPHNDYWAGHARVLLSAYLMAAALDGAGVETLLAWIAAPDDGRPMELLRAGPVPEWASECKVILSLPAEDVSCVLFTAQDALRANLQPTADEPG